MATVFTAAATFSTVLAALPENAQKLIGALVVALVVTVASVIVDRFIRRHR